MASSAPVNAANSTTATTPTALWQQVATLVAALVASKAPAEVQPLLQQGIAAFQERRYLDAATSFGKAFLTHKYGDQNLGAILTGTQKLAETEGNGPVKAGSVAPQKDPAVADAFAVNPEALSAALPTIQVADVAAAPPALTTQMNIVRRAALGVGLSPEAAQQAAEAVYANGQGAAAPAELLKKIPPETLRAMGQRLLQDAQRGDLSADDMNQWLGWKSSNVTPEVFRQLAASINDELTTAADLAQKARQGPSAAPNALVDLLLQFLQHLTTPDKQTTVGMATTRVVPG